MSPAAVFITAVSLAFAADEPTKESPVRIEEDGFRVHELESSFQQGQTQIRVLLPERTEPDRRYPAIYILPVEAGSESRYGDGLLEVKKHNLHNDHRFIAVAPTFSDLPWYADHPSDPTIRQEAYFLETVVPLVEKSYPVDARPAGRLLLGFSKSGWGAWSLLLRHPDRFGRAAAWDAPLMMDRLGKFGTARIFETQANFESHRILDLLHATGHSLGRQPRLILTGYGNFRHDHQELQTWLDNLRVPHTYRDGPPRQHNWHSGWLPEATLLLLDREKQ